LAISEVAWEACAGDRPAWLRTPAHGWCPGTLDRDALHASAAVLARTDGFAAAAARFAREWQHAYDGNAALRSVMRNSARYLFLVTCVWMHQRSTRVPGDDGVTLARLIAFYAANPRVGTQASASRLKEIVAHCKSRGLLHEVPATHDARRRPLEPTPKLIDALAAWTVGFLRGLAPVLPLPATPEAMVATPSFVAELFQYRVAAVHEDGFALPERLPVMQWVMSREKGYHVFLSLVRDMQLGPAGDALVPTHAGLLAREAGVARGTALNLLEGLEARGLLVRSPRSLHLRAEFVELACLWVALEMLWMHGLACAAFARLSHDAAGLQT
jgi:hypothetical protein